MSTLMTSLLVSANCWMWTWIGGTLVSHIGWPQQPAIIARFCSRKVRDSIFSQRHRLHSCNRSHPKARMFINESLTKTNRRCFNQCLRYRKEKSFKYIWTKQGNTILRQTEGSPVIAIKTESDLVKYDIN